MAKMPLQQKVLKAKKKPNNQTCITKPPLYTGAVFDYNKLVKLPTLNLRKIKGFTYRHRISMVIVFLAILAAIGITWYMLGREISFVAPTLKTTPPKETRVEAPLTGELVDPAIAKKRVLAVVIENSPDARPQSGYNEADVVYETLAEGGITRTLALYQSKESKEIGPVRSARDYFIEWLSEYNGIFAHIGGSAVALRIINSDKIPDLNQFYNANYFWRSTDRYAPHNVYTTTDKLYAAAIANKLATTGAPKPFSFKKDAEVAARPASQTVTVNFSGPLFQVIYKYNPATNLYARFVAGVAAKDKNTGVQVTPKNIIVEYTTITPYINDEGAQGVHIGTKSGKGVFFQDGIATEITWTKDSRTARTIYRDLTGKEIKFNRGQTWIEVAPQDMKATY